MAEANITLTFTPAEVDAVLGWAGMAGVGFQFGGTPDPKDPSITAQAKLQKAQDSEA